MFLSVNDHHKTEAVEVARRFAEMGFRLVATRGTAAALRNAGLVCKTVFKVNEGRPNAVDLLKAGGIQLAVYTTTGAPAFHDEKAIRRTAVHVPGAVHHDAERRARGSRCGDGPAAGSDPGLEPAGDPFGERIIGHG